MVIKIHTRTKSRAGIKGTHLRHSKFFSPVGKKHRPKTFASEASAQAAAAAQGHKEGSYAIKKAKHGRRFTIETYK